MASAWLFSTPLILASSSPIRLQLLKQAAIAVESVPACIDERELENRLQHREPHDIAMALAQEKAHTISRLFPERWVLGVDQMLIFNGQSLSKSVSREAGLTKLREMSGHSHDLFSAAALVRNSSVEGKASDQVELRMRILSNSFLDWYAENFSDALTASVGGYRFEHIGSHLFDNVQGDYFTTLGLPLLPLLQEFRRLGLVIT
jgi:septum formation protein